MTDERRTPPPANTRRVPISADLYKKLCHMAIHLDTSVDALANKLLLPALKKEWARINKGPRPPSDPT